MIDPSNGSRPPHTDGHSFLDYLDFLLDNLYEGLPGEATDDE